MVAHFPPNLRRRALGRETGGGSRRNGCDRSHDAHDAHDAQAAQAADEQVNACGRGARNVGGLAKLRPLRAVPSHVLRDVHFKDVGASGSKRSRCYRRYTHGQQWEFALRRSELDHAPAVEPQ